MGQCPQHTLDLLPCELIVEHNLFYFNINIIRLTTYLTLPDIFADLATSEACCIDEIW